MSQETTRNAERDTSASTFTAILSRLHEEFDQIEAAIFFDREGETIDYHSFVRPFQTRLAAAHHGLIFNSARARLQWLNFGALRVVEMRCQRFETITVPVGEEFYLLVIAESGSVSPRVYDAIFSVAEALREEAGL